MQRNSPEFVLVPSEADKYISTTVKVSVKWAHIDSVLRDKSCVKSYLVEYREYNTNYYDEGRRISKRESVSSSSQISPPLPPETTSFVVSIPDDCNVFSVKLVLVAEDSEGRKRLLNSRARKFWPAGHRTSVETFSDAVVLTWPPVCGHVTRDWRLETCGSSIDACSIRHLRGESPLHIAKLRPCNSYTFRLLSPPENGARDNDEDLWSFNQVRTLPQPDFDVVAGHTTLRLRIKQESCEPKAVVRHWRITHCTHVPQQRRGDNDKQKMRKEEEEEGSGDGSDEEDSEDYYYYENNENGGSSASHDNDGFVEDKSPVCSHSQYDIFSSSSTDGGLILLEGLARCTLYSMDIIPTDASGATLQPGEQYGTIHSTLCDENERTSSSDESFFFKDDEDHYGGERGELSSDRVVVVAAALMWVFARPNLIVVRTFGAYYCSSTSYRPSIVVVLPSRYGHKQSRASIAANA